MKVIIACGQCKQVFPRERARLNEAKKEGWRAYCSDMCKLESKRLGKIIRCGNPNCGKTVYRPRKEIRKVQTSYCSSRCAALVNNRNRPVRMRELHSCANAGCDNNVWGKLKYCSVTCFGKARTAHEPHELLAILRKRAQGLNRTPAKRELGTMAYSCVRAFGSWNNALVSAGLVPHRSHSARMYRRTRTVARDGHRCDSVSEALIDNWLDDHGIGHVRDAPYPETQAKADWKLEEGTFVEYFGLASDSPRYDRSIKQKRRLCKKHGIRLIELYPSDLYPRQKLACKLGNHYSVFA